MIEILFFFVLLLYAVLSAKIDEWTTISILGFKSHTPALFLKKPIVYNLIRFSLFFIAILLSFNMKYIPWYIGLFILAIIWIGAGWVGRINAFNDYRQIFHNWLQQPETTPEQKSEYLVEANKTDQELQDKIDMLMKLNNLMR